MLGFAAGLLLGDWLQMQQAALWPLGAHVALLAVGIVLLLAARRWPARRTPALLLAAAALGAGSTGWRAQQRLAERLAPALWGAELTLAGAVVGLPQRRAWGCSFVFAVHTAPRGVPPRVLASWRAAPQAPCPLRGGERWRLRLRLQPVHGRANPGGFDAELQRFVQDIGAVASVRSGSREGAGAGLDALRERLRERLQRALHGHAQAGAVAALALGDQGAVDAVAWARYRDTGVAHLFAISGLHIALLAAATGGVAARLWRRVRVFGRAAPLWLAAPTLGVRVRLLAALGYALLAGFGVPAQRALLMLAAVAAAQRRGLRADWRQTMAWALAAVLLWEPWALLQAGFWLSFGAVAALFVASPPTRSRDAPPARWPRAPRWLREATRAQLAVGVALAPLTVAFFQQIAWVSPLANAVAIPLVTLAVVPLALAGLALLQALQPWLEWLQRWPRWALPLPPAPALLAAALAVPALLLPWGWRLRLGGAALLAPLLWMPGGTPEPGRLEVWIADVGQGSAVLVRTARHALLFDSGPPGAGEQVLLPLLRALGVARVDRVVLSHGDADHVGGAAELARALPSADLIGSLARGQTFGFASVRRCMAGQHWRWDDVEFSMLHPPPGVSPARRNAASCVLRVAGDHGSVLLSGDIERAQELALAASGAQLRVDLLLVPHHGSRGASSPALLRATRARVAAVQAGWRNRYGHPHAQALQRYAQQGIALHRTDLEGALRWQDREPGVLCGWRARHPHYWQQTRGVGNSHKRRGSIG